MTLIYHMNSWLLTILAVVLMNQSVLAQYKLRCEIAQRVEKNELIVDYYVINRGVDPNLALAASNFSLFMTRSNLQLDSAKIDFTAAGPWHSATAPNDYTALSVGGQDDNICLNINSITRSTGSGQPVPLTRTRIGRLRIPILNPAGFNTVTWRTMPMEVHQWPATPIKQWIEFVNPAPDFPLCSIPDRPVLTAAGPLVFCQGSGSVVLNSSYTGTNKWFRDGIEIAGQTGNSLIATIPGTYTVKATYYSCESEPAEAGYTLQIIEAPTTPVITANGPVALCSGQSVTLSIPAGGSTAQTYQWYKNNLPITGAHTNQLTVTAAGDYTVEVTAAPCPSVISAPLTVSEAAVPTAPVLALANATGNPPCSGTPQTITSSFAGAHIWYKDGVVLSGQTANSLTVTTSGSYQAQAVNEGCSSPLSAAVDLSFVPAPAAPTLTASGPTEFCQGQTVTLSSSHSGVHKWYKDGVEINGVTGKLLTVNTSGNYTAQVMRNNCLSSFSTAVSVKVLQKPTIPIITPVGEELVVDTDPAVATIEWYFNGTIITGANAPRYKPAPSQTGTYYVIAKNVCGSTRSEDFSTAAMFTANSLASRVDFGIYPNPYRGSTMIAYQLPVKSDKVTLAVFDELGRKVQTIYSGSQAAGKYEYEFGAVKSGLAAGSYIIRLQVDGQELSQRIVEIH